jgi:hypothetical protein
MLNSDTLAMLFGERENLPFQDREGYRVRPGPGAVLVFERPTVADRNRLRYFVDAHLPAR